MSMHDVMVDLETLDTVAGAAIVSIGAVAFGRSAEEGFLGAEFYRVVRLKSCMAAGLSVSRSTMEWWQGQPDNVRATLVDAENGGLDLRTVLSQFTGYLSDFGLDRVRIWGNGANFDNSILEVAYSKCGLVQPWNHWNSRCFRTLKAEFPGGRDIKFERSGIHHNALDDAITQAAHAAMIFREIDARLRIV